jgi:hypothetical protein
MACCRSTLLLCAIASTLLTATVTRASELKPRTVEAFQHYEAVTEARIRGELADPQHFLVLDSLPDEQKQAEIARVKGGQVYVRSLSTKDDGKKIEIPDGLAHHWVAVGFIPRARLEQVLQVAQDFNHHSDFFKPDVQRSELLSREADHFRVYFRFYRKSIVTAVYNTEFAVDFTKPDATHECSLGRAVRIAEVRNAGEKDERELPVGNDRGFLWRLDLYTRYVEVNDGVFVQIEFLGLSRGVPAIFAWLVNPYVKSVPRDYLTGYIGQLNKAVAAQTQEKERLNAETQRAPRYEESEGRASAVP